MFRFSLFISINLVGKDPTTLDSDDDTRTHPTAAEKKNIFVVSMPNVDVMQMKMTQNMYFYDMFIPDGGRKPREIE